MDKKEFKQEIVTKRFSKLPESVQDIILSDELTSSLHKILHTKEIDQKKEKEFNEQITLVMVGLSTKNDLQEYISSNLSLDLKKSDYLFTKINSEILSKIRIALLNELNKKPNAKENTKTDPYREPNTHINE